MIASLALLADIRPIMAPGKSQPDSCTASLTFGFAALLYWGFPVAALLRSVTTLVAALAGRHAIHRALELIVRSLVDLARALGIRSVAEGVESPEVAAALAAMGCDAAQGSSYCGPLDPAAATAWLADHAPLAVLKTRGRGGTHLPRARRPSGRRRPSPAPPAGAVDR